MVPTKPLRHTPYWAQAAKIDELFDISRDTLEEFVAQGRLRRKKPRPKLVLYDVRQLKQIIEES